MVVGRKEINRQNVMLSNDHKTQQNISTSGRNWKEILKSEFGSSYMRWYFLSHSFGRKHTVNARARVHANDFCCKTNKKKNVVVLHYQHALLSWMPLFFVFSYVQKSPMGYFMNDRLRQCIRSFPIPVRTQPKGEYCRQSAIPKIVEK